MEIYLVQHGKAESTGERPLSATGSKETERMAKHVAKRGLKVKEIYHSTKLRAKQTAEIFSTHLKAKASEMENITPTADPSTAALFLEQQDKPVMIVGHLPHLSSLVAQLVTRNQEDEVLQFRNSAVVCLSKEEQWRIKWVLWPEML